MAPMRHIAPARRKGGRVLPGVRAFWLALWLAVWLPAHADGQVGWLAATDGPVWLLDRADETAAGASDARDTWLDSRDTPLRHMPLGPGDRVRTGQEGRATLQLQTLVLRLGPDSELHIEQMDADQLWLWLPRGHLALLVPGDLDGRPIVLRTPEGRLWPLRAGHYRLSRVHDSTQATAWDGDWRFDAEDSALDVPQGRRADFWLQGRPPRTHYAWMGVDRDAFADWARREARSDTAAWVALPPDVADLPGAAELQRWGDWRDEPGAGRVWQPRQLPPGWAPYRDGRWAWIAPGGWAWIDAAPWAVTPYRSGRWLLIGGRWCWAPGPSVAPRHLRPSPHPPRVHPHPPAQPLPPPHLHPAPHPYPYPPAPAQPLRPPVTQVPIHPPAPAAPPAATPRPPRAERESRGPEDGPRRSGERAQRARP